MIERTTSFTVTYDPDGDVLYISKRKAPSARGIEDEHGFVWRYDRDGDLIGVTVTDFRDFWHSQKGVLAHEISTHFAITQRHANVVLNQVMHTHPHP
ncbi:MAG: DUF2283 domain-containing protein [Hyphomicrobiales bacterium]|nr:DUF2283 domain-containing protein [Hyphomicrobiales bacterium]